jgi:hypothetical protein
MQGEQIKSPLVLDSVKVDASNIDEWVGRGF